MKRILFCVLLSACATSNVVTNPKPVLSASTIPTSVPVATASADPLNNEPSLSNPINFVAPTIRELKTDKGIPIWFLEKHSLPLVSVTVTITNDDIISQPGLAYILADMLDEGAGKRNALELSNDFQKLGASLSVGATHDGSFVTLTVLKRNFDQAFQLFTDVVLRPRFEKNDFDRVTKLWKNDLKQREDDPKTVARIVANAVWYESHAKYGTPIEGRLANAERISLESIKKAYQQTWHPKNARFIAIGDLTEEEVLKSLNHAFGAWKTPRPKETSDIFGSIGGIQTEPRLFLVDIPEASQTVITMIGYAPHVRANRIDFATVDLINAALGGSFTSRLNQNLREDHGWTYGVHSSLVELRTSGAFVVRTSVITEATQNAISELQSELKKLQQGISFEELAKSQSQARTDLVQSHESISALMQRYTKLALLGLDPSHDAEQLKLKQSATLESLKSQYAHFAPERMNIVVVGPQQKILPMLCALKLGTPEIWTVEALPAKDKLPPCKN